MDFTEKYSYLWEEISCLEKDADVRINYIKQLGIYDDFFTDLMKATEHKDRFTNYDSFDVYIEALFMAMREVLSKFDIVHGGDSFIRYIRKIYNFNWKKDTADYYNENKLAGATIAHNSKGQNKGEKSPKKTRQLMQLIDRVDKNRLETKHAYEVIWEEVAEGTGYGYEEFVALYDITHGVIELDAPFEGDESEMTKADLIEETRHDDENPEKAFFTGTSDVSPIINTYKIVLEKQLGFGKTARPYIQAFFTNQLLKALKYDKFLNPFTIVPAGNEDVYQSLKPHREVLFDIIFNRQYLNYAFDPNINGKDPEVLYEVYAWLLNTLFSLDDAGMAKGIGVAPSTISKKRKIYEEKVKPAMVRMIYNYSE